MSTKPTRPTAPALLVHRVAAILTLLLVVGGCSEPLPVITLDDRVDQLQADLVGQGTTADVAACVTRLAEYDLRVAELDPVVLDELILNCKRAEQILDQDDEPDDNQRLAFVDGPNTLGDDGELDRLWRACSDGGGQACDDLFEQSAVGSEYERFGVSCGQRDDVLNCQDLDEVEQPEE